MFKPPLNMGRYISAPPPIAFPCHNIDESIFQIEYPKTFSLPPPLNLKKIGFSEIFYTPPISIHTPPLPDNNC